MMMKRLCATCLVVVCAFYAFAGQKSQTIVYINGSKFYIHTVHPGETLYSLSRQYGVGEKTLMEYNPALASGLKADEKIKIPYQAEVQDTKPEKKLRKTFDMHYVVKGETLYGISRKYEIPIQTIIEDNPNLDPTHLRLGERILIRKKEVGTGDEAQTKAQWEAYRKTLNSVADAGFAYHIVRPGETFYSLARRFETTEEELSSLNNGLLPADLKAGAMLKVPGGTARIESQPNGAEQADSTATESTTDDRAPEITFRALRRSAELHVALLLPLAVDSDVNGNYLEFYQGFLLALDSIKQRNGISVNLSLYNTGRDTAKIRRIVESDDFRNTNLIVGPVYEQGLYPVVKFAEEHAVPVVSPLAHISAMNSDALFQLAPDPEKKYEKIGDLLNGDKRITLIYTESTDKEFEQEMLALLANSEYTKYTYKYEHPSARRSTESPSDLTPLLQNDADNVFVIMADNEIDIDRILAALASADTSITSRGHSAPKFVVMGNARWNRYNNLDRSMFFKDRLVFISTYHAKRDSSTITDFDSAYIRAFGALPTLYSYRGYDTAMIFVPAMYSDIEYDMEGRSYTPLQTTYRFMQGEERHNHTNQNWTRVNYNTDFTITLE